MFYQMLLHEDIAAIGKSWPRLITVHCHPNFDNAATQPYEYSMHSTVPSARASDNHLLSTCWADVELYHLSDNNDSSSAGRQS